jgi:hypothetical protein
VNERLLAQAVRALSAAPDAARVLQALADLLVAGPVDWCLGDVLEPPDLITRVAAVGREGPLRLSLDLGRVDDRRSSAQAVGALAHLVVVPGRRLHLTLEVIRGLVTSDDPRLRAQAELALTLGTTEALVLGLVSQDQLLGVLTVGRRASGFDASDMELLGDVAALAGMALHGVRLRALERGVSTVLQRSLLPQLPVVPGLSFAARFTPAGKALAVGGDWYDAFVLPSGEVAVVVGDATGHDVQAAARMAELRNLLRAIAVDRQDTPAGTLARLDRVTGQLAADLSGTCLYARIGPAERGGRPLSWSSAGHLPPVLLRGGVTRLLETEPDLMLGVVPETPRTDHAHQLFAGDVLVLYTDGLVEDRRTGLDERLEVLTRLVGEIGAGDGLDVLADQLIARLASREDDVAVLVVRVEDGAEA